MMLDIAIDADAEWDNSTDWERLVRAAATSAVASPGSPDQTSTPL